MGCYHGPPKVESELDRATAGNLASHLRRIQRAGLVGANDYRELKHQLVRVAALAIAAIENYDEYTPANQR